MEGIPRVEVKIVNPKEVPYQHELQYAFVVPRGKILPGKLYTLRKTVLVQVAIGGREAIYSRKAGELQGFEPASQFTDENVREYTRWETYQSLVRVRARLNAMRWEDCWERDEARAIDGIISRILEAEEKAVSDIEKANPQYRENLRAKIEMMNPKPRIRPSLPS